MAELDPTGRGLRVGDSCVSKFGTNLRLTITGVDKKTISFNVQRRSVNRKTGEVLIQENDRTVDRKDWRHVAAGYVSARKA